jgi:DNA-binding MarR family transcriptional regulator
VEDLRFELFSDTVYTLIPLLKKHFLVAPEVIDECGSLTKTHLPLLFLLHSTGALTMTEAARQTGSSKPHMTLQADKLVDEGLIERKTDAVDRRSISVRLTPRGEVLVRHLKDMMKEKAWKLFSALSDETLEKTLGALLTLKEVMTHAEGQDAKSGKPEPANGLRQEPTGGTETH